MREGLHKIVSGDETIVAISTALGRSAIGIVRVSGARTSEVAARLFRSNVPLGHRKTCVGVWLDIEGVAVDEVVVSFAQAPHSYTGEDLIEISAHGNPLILNQIVQTIRDCGARLAVAGEFTLRAVANGKMDLTQAEAVREFIDAQTEQQARTALRQIEGATSRKIAPAKGQLVHVIAHLEAGIDFAEDDVVIPTGGRIASELTPILESLCSLKETFGYGRMLIEGARLTIVGKPNVGKSSLFNRLLSADRAIVTPVPGTTRDVLTEALDLGGIPLRISDTAGLRDTSDLVESIGVGRSLEAISEADLTLVVLDGSMPLDGDDETVLGKTAGIPRVIVINKADLPETIELNHENSLQIRVSAISGSGIEELRKGIQEFLVDRKSDLADDFVLTNTRQYEALEKATDSLKAASCAVLSGVPHEMVLLDLYAALEALNELTGDIVTEDILDKIFSTFCIGK